MAIAQTPQPPYYAVVFTSKRTAEDDAGYAAMAQKMDDLAATQSGYLGIEGARSPDGFGITVSYWKDRASISAWKQNADHQIAQQYGRSKWYEHYELRICVVEADYGTRQS